jgi:hypothetical protein
LVPAPIAASMAIRAGGDRRRIPLDRSGAEGGGSRSLLNGSLVLIASESGRSLFGHKQPDG